MKKEDLDYEQIIKDYNNDKLVFSIELSRARFFLLKDTIYANKYYLWTFLNYLIFPILIFVTSMFEMGIWGAILYSLVSFIFFFDISASSSRNFGQAKTTICIFAIICIVIKFLLNINLNLSFGITLIQYVSIYLFYVSIGKTIINKFLLADKDMFYALYDDIFYVK